MPRDSAGIPDTASPATSGFSERSFLTASNGTYSSRKYPSMVAVWRPSTSDGTPKHFLVPSRSSVLPRPRLVILLKQGEAIQQSSNLAPFTECVDIFSPLLGDKNLTSRVHRLSSNETKIASRSVHTVIENSNWVGLACIAIFY